MTGPVARLLLALAIALCASRVAAHELRPAYLAITEIAPDSYAITWKVPARGDMRLALDVILPAHCADTGPRTTRDAGDAIATSWTTRCDGGLAGASVAIDGLSGTYTDALLRFEDADGLEQSARLTPDVPRYTILATPPAIATARTYFVLGVEHILLGADHLLFVLALLLLIRSPRTLVETITAFTVAHSITLAAAALGWTNVPPPPVEAAIALSIVVVAAEIVRSGRGRTDFSIRHPWVIAFLFGLLHGFGFGGALRDIGLPQTDVPLALSTFNLGVEAGQLLFVAAVLVAIAAIRAVAVRPLPAVRTLAAYLIGSLSAFWFFSRLWSF